MLIRATDAFESLLAEYAASFGFACYYFQWDGYLDSRKPAFNESLHAFLQPYPIVHLHTSGHADVNTLRAVIETVKPTRGIIPIHTDASEAYEKWFGDVARVVRLRDGVGFECGV
jgi:ribonuclease J